MTKNKIMANEKSQPITMEEMNQLHDEWWASLSNEDKEKLYNEMVESEIQYYSNLVPVLCKNIHVIVVFCKKFNVRK